MWPIPGLPGSLHLLRYSLPSYQPCQVPQPWTYFLSCCIVLLWTCFLPCHVSQPLVCFPPQKVSQPCSLPSSITSCFTYLFQRLPFWKSVQLATSHHSRNRHHLTIAQFGKSHHSERCWEWQPGPKWCDMTSVKRLHIIPVGHSFTKTIFVKLFHNISQ